MKKSQTSIFNDHFYWKFKAPNKKQLTQFIYSLDQCEDAPWGELCSVTNLSITEDIFDLLQPSLVILGQEVEARMTVSMNRPWVSQYVRGDFQEAHDHNDCDFVGVFFPEYKEGYSKFYFIDRGVNLRKPIMDLMGVRNNHIVDVEGGDIIFFPGHMLHGVSKHDHNDTRRTLSCNFFIKQIDRQL